jgi:hypothetical protein
MPSVTTLHPQPHQQRHRQMNQRAEQPWLGLARCAHPALGAVDLGRPDGWRSVGRTKDGRLEHIPGPMVADEHPQRVGVQSEEHQRRAARQHAEHLLWIEAMIERKVWNEHGLSLFALY